MVIDSAGADVSPGNALQEPDAAAFLLQPGQQQQQPNQQTTLEDRARIAKVLFTANNKAVRQQWRAGRGPVEQREFALGLTDFDPELQQQICAGCEDLTVYSKLPSDPGAVADSAAFPKSSSGSSSSSSGSGAGGSRHFPRRVRAPHNSRPNSGTLLKQSSVAATCGSGKTAVTYGTFPGITLKHRLQSTGVFLMVHTGGAAARAAAAAAGVAIGSIELRLIRQEGYAVTTTPKEYEQAAAAKVEVQGTNYKDIRWLLHASDLPPDIQLLQQPQMHELQAFNKHEANEHQKKRAAKHAAAAAAAAVATAGAAVEQEEGEGEGEGEEDSVPNGVGVQTQHAKKAYAWEGTPLWWVPYSLFVGKGGEGYVGGIGDYEFTGEEIRPRRRRRQRPPKNQRMTLQPGPEATPTAVHKEQKQQQQSLPDEQQLAQQVQPWLNVIAPPSPPQQQQQQQHFVSQLQPWPNSSAQQEQEQQRQRRRLLPANEEQAFAQQLLPEATANGPLPPPPPQQQQQACDYDSPVPSASPFRHDMCLGQVLLGQPGVHMLSSPASGLDTCHGGKGPSSRSGVGGSALQPPAAAPAAAAATVALDQPRFAAAGAAMTDTDDSAEPTAAAAVDLELDHGVNYDLDHEFLDVIQGLGHSNAAAGGDWELHCRASWEDALEAVGWNQGLAAMQVGGFDSPAAGLRFETPALDSPLLLLQQQQQQQQLQQEQPEAGLHQQAAQREVAVWPQQQQQQQQQDLSQLDEDVQPLHLQQQQQQQQRCTPFSTPAHISSVAVSGSPISMSYSPDAGHQQPQHPLNSPYQQEILILLSQPQQQQQQQQQQQSHAAAAAPSVAPAVLPQHYHHQHQQQQQQPPVAAAAAAGVGTPGILPSPPPSKQQLMQQLTALLQDLKLETLQVEEKIQIVPLQQPVLTRQHISKATRQLYIDCQLLKVLVWTLYGGYCGSSSTDLCEQIVLQVEQQNRRVAEAAASGVPGARDRFEIDLLTLREQNYGRTLLHLLSELDTNVLQEASMQLSGADQLVQYIRRAAKQCTASPVAAAADASKVVAAPTLRAVAFAVAAAAEASASSGCQLCPQQRLQLLHQVRYLAQKEGRWSAVLRACNSNGATAWLTACYWCIPEVLQFLITDPEFDLHDMMFPSRTGRFFYHYICRKPRRGPGERSFPLPSTSSRNAALETTLAQI